MAKIVAARGSVGLQGARDISASRLSSVAKLKIYNLNGDKVVVTPYRKDNKGKVVKSAEKTKSLQKT